MKVQGTTIQAVRPLVREIRQGQPASQFQVYAGSTLVGGGVVMTNGAAARQALEQARSPGGVSAEKAEVFKALGEIAWAVVQHCAGMSMPGYLTKPVGSDVVARQPPAFTSRPFTPARPAVTGREMPLTLLRSAVDAAEFLGDYVDYPLPVELGLKVFKLGRALILLGPWTQDHPEAGAGDHARPEAAAIDGAHAAPGAGGGTRPDAGARWSAAAGPWDAKAVDGAHSPVAPGRKLIRLGTALNLLTERTRDHPAAGEGDESKPVAAAVDGTHDPAGAVGGAHPDAGARGGGLPSAGAPSGVPSGTLVGAGGLGIVGLAGGLPLAVRFTRPGLSPLPAAVTSPVPDAPRRES
jgi:hypothetical protein